MKGSEPVCIRNCILRSNENASGHNFDIYTIILLKSVCRCSQTAGRNYSSIVLEMSLTVRIV